MCGRYALLSDPEEIRQRFGLKEIPGVSPRFNVCPGQMMPVILSENPATAVLAKWGLIPSWAKDPNIGYRMINARAESISDKPAFRQSLKFRRCLIPATGFYEWMHVDREKIPYYFSLADSKIFAFAGLYDRWSDAEGKQLLTFTIITTEPSSVVRQVHDRMPVILPPETESDWLDISITDRTVPDKMLFSRMKPDLHFYQVSKDVNNPENDSSDLIIPELNHVVDKLF